MEQASPFHPSGILTLRPVQKFPWRYTKRQMQQPEDEAREALLIAASQRGDVTAFNSLAALHERAVYTVAYRTLGNADAATDVTQDALLAAYQHVRSFRGGSFRAWLARITVNKAYDALRASQRRRESSLDVTVPQEQQDAPMDRIADDDPEGVALQRELGHTLQVALQTLPLDQRTVVVLFDIQGYSYDEIAYIERTRVGTVKSRLSRARARLRDYLIEHREQLPEHFRLP